MPSDIYWIEGIPPRGRLAICARPRGDDWLVDDVREWKESGANLIVSLLVDEETVRYALQNEATACAEFDLDFIRFPIEDMSVPTDIPTADELIQQIVARLNEGENVIIHCRIGIGRSSTIAAAVMTHFGVLPPHSFQVISQFRGHDVPDTDSQIEWVTKYADVD